MATQSRFSLFRSNTPSLRLFSVFPRHLVTSLFFIVVFGSTPVAFGQEGELLLAENATNKSLLEALKVSLDKTVQQAVVDKSENVDGLKHWQVLAQQFVFDENTWQALEKKSREGKALFELKKSAEAQ